MKPNKLFVLCCRWKLKYFRRNEIIQTDWKRPRNHNSSQQPWEKAPQPHYVESKLHILTSMTLSRAAAQHVSMRSISAFGPLAKENQMEFKFINRKITQMALWGGCWVLSKSETILVCACKTTPAFHILKPTHRPENNQATSPMNSLIL